MSADCACLLEFFPPKKFSKKFAKKVLHICDFRVFIYGSILALTKHRSGTCGAFAGSGHLGGASPAGNFGQNSFAENFFKKIRKKSVAHLRFSGLYIWKRFVLAKHQSGICGAFVRSGHLGGASPAGNNSFVISFTIVLQNPEQQKPRVFPDAGLLLSVCLRKSPRFAVFHKNVLPLLCKMS